MLETPGTSGFPQGRGGLESLLRRPDGAHAREGVPLPKQEPEYLFFSTLGSARREAILPFPQARGGVIDGEDSAAVAFVVGFRMPRRRVL